MKNLVILLTLWLTAVLGMQAQVTQMTGTVVGDDDGQPIYGASVVVTGTQIGTVTDLEGRFYLSGIPADARTITVSYVGMEPKTVGIAPSADIVLIPSNEALDEVIIVAFGRQKRESFTGSASVVSSAQIERQQVSNPIEALAGNVTGLNMVEANSFTSNPTITIRGIGSLNASTAPLIVLDGLPYSGYWNDINPADVASITVLKDAASNALYGARGANGVILITTKGAQRGKTRTTVEAKWGANSDARVKYRQINDPGQYYEAQYMALNNYYFNAMGLGSADAHILANRMLGGAYSEGGLGYMVYSVPEGQYLIGTNGRLNPAATLGNRVAYGNEIYTLMPDDWTAAGLRTGFRQEYNLNITGGNDQYSMLASLGYLKDEGIATGSDLERVSARFKADYQAYPFLKIGANAGYTYNQTNSSGAVFDALTSMAPVYPLYIRDADGRVLTDAHGPRYDYGDGANAGCLRPVDANGNYIQDDLLNVNRNSSNAFNIQGYATADFLRHFRLTVNGSVYITENRYNAAFNPYYGFSTVNGGSATVSHYRNTDLNFQQLLSYNRVFGRNTVDVLLGHEYNRNTDTGLSATRTRLAMFDQNIELDGAIVDSEMGSSVSRYNVEGYFLRAQYDFDNRYFASGSFRRDGSSRFHPRHRWGNFWSLGAAWILSKEAWFPKASVNMLKLKVSYGEQGNDGIGNYRFADTYTIKNADGEVAFVFNNKGNPDITWETVGSFNAGVEMEMFGSRLSIGAEAYVRNTRNMLMWLTVPNSLGYDGYYDNIGDMRNTGVELTLGGDIIANRNFAWNIGLNLTWESNRVTYLPDDKKGYTVDGFSGYPNGVTFIAQGKPVRTFYLKQYAGVSDDGQAMFWATAPDGSRYATTRYDDADEHLCGSALPDVFGGFNTSLRVYGFDLNVQFNYSIGGKKWDTVYQGMMTPPASGLSGQALHRDLFGAWTPANPTSDIPRWQYNDLYTAAASDRWLTDASYLTLRNISLGYTITPTVTRKWGMSRVRVFATADNIYYWTKRKGFDPRMGTYYGNYNPNSGYSFPSRTISGGLNIQF